ncbi:MAG: RelA/SpoT family protein [Helicobacteraceae bacterium]|jgi:RelA/SpoT family (p)ppGpp synthetase|nr:RelA/SpoT family protein [Helicobacteraceae bacterium]
MNEDIPSQLASIRDPQTARDLLFSLIDTPALRSACDKAQKVHQGQTRKSGEEYIVHPLLVASAVAIFGGDEAMAIAGVLHDAIEDTDCTYEEIQREFGDDAAKLVDGLTKIDRIREENLLPSSRVDEQLIASALTFRKMLLASIQDVRVLVIKLCDRLHNIITLDALSEAKQRRIAEETLVVYAPIAHRLGIGKIKTLLEDKSFYYIFPEEYKQIDSFITARSHALRLGLNAFIAEIKALMLQSGFEEGKFEIDARLKHYYSIYTKMQRKGIKIDEVLDLMAARILVNSVEECYKALGLLHVRYRPLIARFKEYVALPKENGYQTLHTTLFHASGIYEVQIRTYDMHKTAEYGIAAHWKYKAGALSPNLNWLETMQYSNESPLDFYELAKNDLYSDEVVAYSPRGQTFTLPRGATALDFAFMVHSEVGLKATDAFINRIKQPLLTELKTGDMVQIATGNETMPRCSWIGSLKTSRARNIMRHVCNQRNREIDRLNALAILRFCLDEEAFTLEIWLKLRGYEEAIYKVSRDNKLIDEIISRYNKDKHKKGLFGLNLSLPKRYRIENLEIVSPKAISAIDFDYCCHPKYGDSILLFYHKRGRATIHHKLCENAYRKLKEGGNALKASWIGGKVELYRLVVNLENKKGALLALLTYLSRRDVNIATLSLGNGSEGIPSWCEITAEIPTLQISKIRSAIEKRFGLVSFSLAQDIYEQAGK